MNNTVAPSLWILKREQNDDYVIVRHGSVVGRGGIVLVGENILVAGLEFRRKGLEVAMEYLNEFQEWEREKKPQAELDTMDPQRRNRFLKNHRFVICKRMETDQFIVCPIHRTGGGMKGLKYYVDDYKYFSIAINQDEFMEILDKCFDEAI